MNLLNLPGRVALVTGASGDIGAEIAKLFSLHCAEVAIHYVSNREFAEDLAGGLRRSGRRALAVQADLTNSGDVHRMTEQTAAEFGGVDILINNAGTRRKPGDHKYILEVTEEEWDVELNSHLRAAFLCCKAVLPHMIARKRGRIINLSSVVAHSGAVGASVHYPAAKAGMFGFTKALANQVAHEGITCNVLAPGIIDSERVRWRTPEQMKEHTSKIPLGRLGSVEEIAAAALFLASDSAGYITGATLDVNGGLYMA